MTEVNFIIEWTENLKLKIKGSPFDSQDIRKDYLGLTFDIAYSYYKAYILLDFADFINNNQIVFKEELKEYLPHLQRVAETNNHDILRMSYFHSLNRRLLIDTWSAFELSVTTVCDAISSVQEKDKLLNFQFNEIFKIFKTSTISESDKAKLKEANLKSHLTHVPIVRKTDFLYSKCKDYRRNIDADKKFLIFLGKLRNTIHTNFIYYGKDYEFYFGNAHYIFKNEKRVVWTDPFEPSPKLYFLLLSELVEIWISLTSTIPFPNTIFYPDLEQQ